MGILAVAHNPESAALVRHSIAEDLQHRDLAPGCVDNIVLVASELVTNALRHTPTSVTSRLDVTWDVEPEAVVVSVVDTSPTPPIQRSMKDTDASGRGLFIVAMLALEWGVRRTNRGKQVWARVPTVRARATSAR